MTTASDVGFTYLCGLTSTMSSAPLIHPFNVIAAAAARTQLTSGKAAAAVYHGLGDNRSRQHPITNFWCGLGGHCSKELVRSVGRIIGVVYIEKDFKQRFSPEMAPVLLATVMAIYEIVLANPADVWKSKRACGLPTKMQDLYQGSLGNGGRQWGMWFVWSMTTPKINKFLDSTFPSSSPASSIAVSEMKGAENQQQPTPATAVAVEVVPFSGTRTGIAARSFMQAVACTLVTYPMELILRTVQVRSSEYPVKNFKTSLLFAGKCLTNPALVPAESAYWRVAADLIKKNGVRGLGLGMSAKVMGNFMLLSNANFLPLFSGWVKKKTGRQM